MRGNDLKEIPKEEKSYWYRNEIKKARNSLYTKQEWVRYFQEKIKILEKYKKKAEERGE